MGKTTLNRPESSFILSALGKLALQPCLLLWRVRPRVGNGKVNNEKHKVAKQKQPAVIDGL